ncbi:unnamed protein product, partial [Nesidiocoris tenuis]
MDLSSCEALQVGGCASSKDFDFNINSSISAGGHSLHRRELARDHLNRLGRYQVIGGIVSPVHDDYGKKELISSTHRVSLLRLALQDSDWIFLSDWEVNQKSWVRTRLVLQHHQ